MPNSIDQQAREQALQEAAVEAWLDWDTQHNTMHSAQYEKEITRRVSFKAGYVAGATRTLAPEEIEAAHKAVHKIIAPWGAAKNLEENWEYLDPQTKDMTLAATKAALRSVGLQCDE